ncbi:MAG: T9SS type A sorting domain-containing protein [Bacteroidota bacterium]
MHRLSLISFLFLSHLLCWNLAPAFAAGAESPPISASVAVEGETIEINCGYDREGNPVYYFSFQFPDPDACYQGNNALFALSGTTSDVTYVNSDGVLTISGIFSPFSGQPNFNYSLNWGNCEICGQQTGDGVQPLPDCPPRECFEQSPLTCQYDQEGNPFYRFSFSFFTDGCYDGSDALNARNGSISNVSYTNSNGLLLIEGDFYPTPGQAFFVYDFLWGSCRVCGQIFIRGSQPLPDCPPRECSQIEELVCGYDAEGKPVYHFSFSFLDPEGCYQGNDALETFTGSLSNLNYTNENGVLSITGTFCPDPGQTEFVYVLQWGGCRLCERGGVEGALELPECPPRDCYQVDEFTCVLNEENEPVYTFQFSFLDPEGCYQGNDALTALNGSATNVTYSNSNGLLTISGTFSPNPGQVIFNYLLNWGGCQICDQFVRFESEPLPECPDRPCFEIESITCPSDPEGPPIYEFVFSFLDPEGCYQGTDAMDSSNGELIGVTYSNDNGVLTVSGGFLPDAGETQFYYSFTWGDCEICGRNFFEGVVELPECPENPCFEIESILCPLDLERFPAYRFQFTFLDPEGCYQADDAMSARNGQLLGMTYNNENGVLTVSGSFLPNEGETQFQFVFQWGECEICGQNAFEGEVDLPECGSESPDRTERIRFTNSTFDLTQFTVHPNPARDFFVLTNKTGATDLQLELMDLLGRRQLIQPTATGQTITFQTHDLPSGTYFLLVRDQNNKTLYSERIVIADKK